MAINNWRYVVTWGFMEPDWTIVEEKQYVSGWPTSTSYSTQNPNKIPPNSYLHGNNTFSPQETFQLKSQGYANIWENALSTVYWDLANSLWQYSGYANSTIWAYDNLLNFMAWNEGKIQWVAGKLYNDLVSDINNQKNYVNSMFGPDWKLTKEIDKYYDDLWNYLATDAGRQAATIAAQWMHSWASLWAIRAQQNQAYNESFWRYVQAKEQQINAKTNVATNLINFMSALRKEYWDSTNQYIIELYKRASDLYNNTAVSLGQDLNTLAKLKFASGWSWGWSWSSLNDLMQALWLINGEDNTSTGDSSSIIKWEQENDEAIEKAKEQLWLELENKESSSWFWPKRWQVYDKTQRVRLDNADQPRTFTNNSPRRRVDTSLKK